LQTTLAPCPNKARDQYEQKNQNGDERADGQSGERDGERHQKHRFHIENQEDDGIQIVLRPELNVRLTNGLDASFVNSIFFPARFRWLEKPPPHPRQRKRDQWKCQRHTNENNNEQVRIRRHLSSVKFVRKAQLPNLYSQRDEDRKTISQFHRDRKVDRDFYKNSAAMNVCEFWWSSLTMGLTKG